MISSFDVYLETELAVEMQVIGMELSVGQSRYWNDVVHDVPTAISRLAAGERVHVSKQDNLDVHVWKTVQHYLERL